ncbi:MAG: DNA-binding protein [Methanomassiliicoccales archaeon]|jgi:predicted DNA-binding protein with PD1-like motif|nr:DNA-binding protein [Methanomassiliicoccales archaeon]
MKYSQGKMGRVFVVRLEDGEVIHKELEQFAADRRVEAATVMIVGAADKGSVLVVGPKRGADMPPIPMEKKLEEACEIEGVGTIFPNEEGKPILHMHIACGREGATVTGCVRRGVKVWKVAEVIIVEMLGVNGRREVDPRTGFELLVPRRPTMTDLTRHPGER